MLALEDIMDFHQLRQQGMPLRIPFPYQRRYVNLIDRFQQQKKIVLVRPCHIEIFPATQAIFPNG